MKILLTGGGSGGPVAPLLAIAEEIKKIHPQAGFLFVGTKQGPEKEMAKQAKLPFVHIAAGKLRRYFSLKNLFAPFFVIAGFFQAWIILRKFKPDCVVGAGSFVQVPVIWAAWLQKIPVVIHQQDLLPSLANTLCQFPAKKITVTFESSLTDFSASLGFFYRKKPDKIVLTGNPFRANLKDADKPAAQKFFKLEPDFPTLLVLGGGTGALYLNKLMQESLPVLAKSVQIIHATGSNKNIGNQDAPHYHAYAFIANIGAAYAAADMVLCRAGLSTITELANLGKAAIVVPMPRSHQEINAMLLRREKAAIVVGQDKMTPDFLTRLVRKLLFDLNTQKILKTNISRIMPKNSGGKIAEIIIKEASAKQS
ncbi:MAG: UDP-N-acetylglucosamine--N-acetylmuramyl-(pentapeptide) pyrophosphoryl-undecaprenol N-acetylglucosamine transferase [Patescibacteria group bacterium]|nr:UDP-N-acetylglucosamine--N-acetylmuramyl-(pentapeptide) pyrophosphoryl-undecaprenol N-acetylglucosamine transferase [Patescibacteria group bacterium]